MRFFLRFLLLVIGCIFSVICLSVFYLWSTEWTPDEVEVRSHESSISSVSLGDTLIFISWNIGYAGLGDDMDFFYDGGHSTRTSKERTSYNLEKIVEFLQDHQYVDFIFLQEVDFNSKRSYGVNQYAVISSALPTFQSSTAFNYVSQYVPIPLIDPIGNVQAGLVTFSRHPLIESKRYQYPSIPSFPERLFKLKLCLLSCQISTHQGDTLYINNTHNTAYDEGGMRSRELKFMNSFLQDKPLSITSGDWNCNPPSYQASLAELEDKNFSPLSIDVTDFSDNLTFLADLSTASARYGYQPYTKGVTTTILDFSLIGRRLTPVSVQTIDLNFKNSDHNPVLYKVVLH